MKSNDKVTGKRSRTKRTRLEEKCKVNRLVSKIIKASWQARQSLQTTCQSDSIGRNRSEKRRNDTKVWNQNRDEKEELMLSLPSSWWKKEVQSWLW